MTKLKIDFQAGILEVEGEETFVNSVYQDYKDKFVDRQPQGTPITGKTSNASQMPINPSSAKSSDSDKKKQKNKTKESFAIVKDLDLSSKGGRQSLRDFFKEKSPLAAMENNAVFVYYLQKIAGVTGITLSHIYSCYKDASVRVPTALKQSLHDTAHRKGWIDTSSMDNIVIATPGENFVEHDLPKVETSK